MSTAGAHPDLLEQSYSSRAGRAGTVFLAAAGGVLAVQAWGSSTRAAVLTLLAAVAITLVAYVIAWRPAVVIDDSAVVLRNLVRDVRVPWNALERVGTRWTLSIETTDGRSYDSWAVHARNRSREGAGRRGVGGLLAGQDLRSVDEGLGLPPEVEAKPGLRDQLSGGSTGFVSERVVARWDRCRATSSGDVEVRWAPAPVAALALAAALVLALALAL